MRDSHIIWDWNGTIVDDAPLSLEILNRTLAKRGIAPLTLERYRDTIDIPESDDYQTVAGYILYHYQTLPRLGETVEIKNFRFTILRRKATKIELVRMKIEK